GWVGGGCAWWFHGISLGVRWYMPRWVLIWLHVVPAHHHRYVSCTFPAMHYRQRQRTKSRLRDHARCAPACCGSSALGSTYSTYQASR
ncbi:hypothetical protein DFP73DRAFT_569620, partial [Morchella snyderi]